MILRRKSAVFILALCEWLAIVWQSSAMTVVAPTVDKGLRQPSSSPPPPLQIGPLLSTCIDACQAGCEAIRAVQAKHNDGDKTNNGQISYELKVAGDNRSALTAADTAAQKAIVGALRQTWGPHLKIIGEEDEDETLTQELSDASSSSSSLPFPTLRTDLLQDDIGETPVLDYKDVTIYVDPLDGTREFVEGRLSNCQTLVGIAIGDQAVAGAVGIPFPAGTNMTVQPTIVYGLADVGTGVVGTPLTRGPFPLDAFIDGVNYPRPHIATSDADVPVMQAARKAVLKKFGGSNVIYGGAGNKILAAALGEVACVMQHKVGGAWDLCAPHAILKAMGGRMTDFWGDEIAIYGPNAAPLANERGYVATPQTTAIDHDALVAVLKASPDVEAYRASIEKKATIGSGIAGPPLPDQASTSKRLFLVRHGEVINPGGDRPVFYGAQDVHLSPLGEKEAQAAADYLAQFDLSAVFASPLKRAVYGAKRIAASQPKVSSVSVLEGFTELNRGAWRGKTKDEIGLDMLARFDSCDPTATPEGGESYPELKQRVMKALSNALSQLEPGQCGAIVSHLQVTRSMLSEALGIPTEDMVKLPIATASITCIEYTSDNQPFTVHFQSFKPDVGLKESKDGAN
jgi:broad specificity phosphatase PhoE/3'-phosphoadenosine 5'-phosphosulfate (PAPS) 3'-phosphatase